MLALLILGFFAMIVVEVPAMAAKGQKGELRAFWVLLTLGFALSLAVVQRWPVPNPTRLVESIFQPVAEMIGLK